MDQDQSQSQPSLTKVKGLASKKVVIALVAVIAIVIGAGLYFLLVGREKQEKATAKIPAPTAIVTITSSGFVPATLSIKAGQTVKWVNSDESPHRVASNPHPTHTGLARFDSKNNLAKDEIFVFNFDKAGTFGYHDHLNPQTLQGVVAVQ